MGKLLVILACVLGTAIAGLIPVSSDRIPWWELERQNVRPTLMDLVTLRWRMNPRIGLVIENRDIQPMREDDQNPMDRIWGNQMNAQPDERFSRLPVYRKVMDGVERDLPTSDVNSNRLLHVGRRRQQQLSKQGLREEIDRDDNLENIRRDEDRNNRRQIELGRDEMTPLRISRIAEGRRVGPMPEEEILNFIRRGNRLTSMSDNEIIEMLRRQRQEKMERRRNEQVEQGDEMVRGKDVEVEDEMAQRRMNRVNEENRMEEREEEMRRVNRQRQEQAVQERLSGRPMDNDESVLSRTLGNLKSLRGNDERLVHINRRRMDQTPNEMPQPQVVRMGEDRPLGENLPENLMRQIDQRMQNRGVNQVEEELQSVRRDDNRLVHINRRRLGQEQQEMIPRRVSRIGEGRRVDPMPEEDVLKLIRMDNRLNQLSDDEITDMIRRQRLEKMERGRMDQDRDVASQDGVDLQSVRRDDESLVHVNRRRIDQEQEEMIPRRVSRIGEGRRVYSMPEEDVLKPIRMDNHLDHISDDEITEKIRRQRQSVRQRLGQEQLEMIPRRVSRFGEGRRVDPMPEEDVLKLIRMDNRLPQLSDNEITEMIRRQRMEKMERVRIGKDQEREEVSQGGDGLQSVRRDDERLVHINRRRLDQTI